MSVWGNCNSGLLDHIFKVQKQCARIILDAPFQARTLPLFLELGWLPINHLCIERRLCLFKKILDGRAPDYLTQKLSSHLTPDECPEIFQFHAVSDKDVESVIRGFASNKAPGYDKVSVRVLKGSLPAILPAITTIMNNSFNTKTFARSWKIAEVTPVLKSGDYEEPCNHRPISLLPVLSKVSERLAHRQFADFLSANKKLARAVTVSSIPRKQPFSVLPMTC